MSRFAEPSPVIDALAHSVIGGAIEVHRQLGPGLLEATYEEALTFELGLRSISVQRQVPFPLKYKGHTVADGRLDLVVEGVLVVELKALERLAAVHRAQLLSYLRASRLPLGLLINFNVEILKHGIRRVIQSDGALPNGGPSSPPI